MSFLDRIAQDPVAYALRIVVLGLLLFAILFFVGCSSTRYLTAEQDAEMREICEKPENHGCAVVPGRVWEYVQKMMGI